MENTYFLLKHSSLHNKPEYLSVDIQSVPRSEQFSVRLEEKGIMTKDKCPSIFSRQLEAVIFISQIFFATRAVLKKNYKQKRTSPKIFDGFIRTIIHSIFWLCPVFSSVF